ncbi:unnamed protein product, partial [Mesorhabditis spiculigera]
MNSPTNYEDPTFFKTSSNVLLVVGTPFNIFTLWIIIKTPSEKASSYRWHLAWFQFWAILQELIFHGVCPEFYLPTLAGSMLGILNLIHPRVLLCFGAMFVVGMLASTLQCFAYRHQVLLPLESRLHLSKRTVLGISLVHYLVPTVWFMIGALTAPIEKGPNSDILRATVQEDPSLSYMFSLDTLYIIDRRPLLPPFIEFSSFTILATSLVAVICYGIPLVIFLVWHSYTLLNDHHSTMSRKTKRMHRKFFRVLIIGVSIPLATLGAPYVAVLLTVWAQIWLPQWSINLLAGIQSAHTTITSVTLLTVTASYRKYILGKVIRCLHRKVEPEPK